MSAYREFQGREWHDEQQMLRDPKLGNSQIKMMLVLSSGDPFRL